MTEREVVQTKRRRGMMLKFIRQGHEQQLSRMDDFEMWAMMQELGQTMGRDQVLTMLQDLGVLGYIRFRSSSNELSGRTELSDIELTAIGLSLMTRRKSNDDVLVD